MLNSVVPIFRIKVDKYIADVIVNDMMDGPASSAMFCNQLTGSCIASIV